MPNKFGEGHPRFDNHRAAANANGGGGHSFADPQKWVASSPTHFGDGHPPVVNLSRDAAAEGGGQSVDDNPVVGASSPTHFGEGQCGDEIPDTLVYADGDDGDQAAQVNHNAGVATSPPLTSESQRAVDNLTRNAAAGSEEEKDHLAVDPPGDHVDSSSLELAIATIRSRHRQRCFAMEQRKRSDLALGSFLRQQLGWSRSLPEAERKRINKQALDLIDLGGTEAKALAKKKPFETDEPAYLEWRELILASVAARSPFEVIEKQATKEMVLAAKTLPVWSWAEPVRGFGAIGLATIVAETGDLSLYANPAKVWKRCGLAVMDGVRQGGLSKNAGAEAWIAHGYNRQRRSRIWTLGDSLLKPAGPYRDIYLARKEYRKARAEAEGLTIAPAGKIPKKRAAEFMSLMHLHRDAQRYMEKRLLKHLWQAWRQTIPAVQPSAQLSAADDSGGE